MQHGTVCAEAGVGGVGKHLQQWLGMPSCPLHGPLIVHFSGVVHT